MKKLTSILFGAALIPWAFAAKAQVQCLAANGCTWADCTGATAPWCACCSNPNSRSVWPPIGGALTMHYRSTDFTGAWLSRLQDAVQVWNNIPETTWRFALTPATGSVGPGNTVSEIWYNSGSSPHGSALLAETYLTFLGAGPQSCDGYATPCCYNCAAPQIAEADVVIYGTANGVAIPWSTNTPAGQNQDPLNSGFYYAVEIMQHELGHASGLMHVVSSAGGLARMSYSAPNGGWFYTGSHTTAVVPQVQDHANIHTLYPATSNYWDNVMMDVSYSPGDRNASRNLSWDPVSDRGGFYPRNAAAPIAGQADYVVHANNTVQYQECHGNLGSATSPGTTITVWLSKDGIRDRTCSAYGCTGSNCTAGCCTGWTCDGDIQVTTYPYAPGNPPWSYGCYIRSFTVAPSVPKGTYFIVSAFGTGDNDTAVTDGFIQVQ
jgi:hypothetical protein